MKEAKFSFTLTVSESKRLIAQGLLASPIINNALESHFVVLSNGITNAYIYEELTDTYMEDKGRYTAGIVVDGVACITDSTNRIAPLVLYKGKPVDTPWLDVVKQFTAQDVLIKGANAIDAAGNAGILLGGVGGGTIGKAYGYLRVAGSKLIIPVSLEKMIPSVKEAAIHSGQADIDYSIGVKCGLFMISDGYIFTELEAIKQLFNLQAIPIAAGGIKDCQGSITLLVKGDEIDVKKCYEYIKSIKGEKATNGRKRVCAKCDHRCERHN